MSQINWIFDQAPDSGMRRAGHAAEEAFRKGLHTLVRETIQNSSDASDGGQEPVQVIYRLIELAGDDMRNFLDSMQWKSLQDNLLAVERNGDALERAVDSMKEEDRIRLLIIEDRKTTGLYGGEERLDESTQNPFLSLVRDEMYSDKNPGGSAGGSFGLGKSVLWAFSSLSTVLFNSIPDENREGGKEGCRFIGRTYLPYHETEEDGQCSGDGWLAASLGVDDGGSRKWKSVRGSNAMELAEQLHCGRAEGEQGTSALVVGFNEPGEDSRPLEEIAEDLRRGIIENFWASIEFGSLVAKVCYMNQGEDEVELDVAPREDPGHEILCDMYRKYIDGKLPSHDSATWKPEPGGMAWVPVKMRIPKKEHLTAPHDECEGEAALLVKLLDKDEQAITLFGSSDKFIKDQVFSFRGPRMLVRQNKYKSMGLGAQPFVAIAVCGCAHEAGENSSRADDFLKSAEPAEHDKWTHKTKAVETNYATRGVQKMLSDFLVAIKSKVRELVTISRREDGTAPDCILKHLRFSSGIGGGGHKHYISVTRMSTELTDGGELFKFHARKIRPKKEVENEEPERPWEIEVKLYCKGDAGSQSEKIEAIEAVECADGICEIQNGVARIKLAPDITKTNVRIEIREDMMPIATARCNREFRIDGRPSALEETEVV